MFCVKKIELLDNVGLFQEDPSLLCLSDYEVKSRVPEPVFETFVGGIEGGTIDLSEDTLEPFYLLAEEFRCAWLSERCRAFVEYRRRCCVSSTDDAEGLGRRVRITAKGRSTTYEVLSSPRQIKLLKEGLTEANADDIVVDGISGKEGIVEEAVMAVYSNTVAALPDCDTKRPFLARILWEIWFWGYSRCIDVSIYCLNRLHDMAPTNFDKAKLLLLSQCYPEFPDDFIPLRRIDGMIRSDAINMLMKEKSRKTSEATDLLGKLKQSGRYKAHLRET
jgi:hypothetical protein